MKSSIEAALVSSCLHREPLAAVLEQWIYWNNSPSRHIAPKKLEQFVPDSFSLLLSGDFRVRNKIDTLLRTQLSWKESVAWTPDDPLLEISMLPPLKFERLALLSAAISLRGAISQVIDGAIVRKLRQEIGADILEFSLLSSWAVHHSLIAEKVVSDDLVTIIQQTAETFVEHAFSGRAHAIQVRLASKLPGCFSKQFFEKASPQAEEAEKLLVGLWKETASWL